MPEHLPTNSQDSPDYGELDDGFGSVWLLCKSDCRLQIVRPGKVQCDCDHDDEPVPHV